MRRIITLLTVVALMAAMMLVMAVPAFALGHPPLSKPPCETGEYRPAGSAHVCIPVGTHVVK